MSHEAVVEARRQMEICNACRYCEGYCSVFPAMTRKRAFSDGDLTQLANLCHNCRGCYYACQYTEPHEFSLNVPAVLAEVRHASWERYAWPAGLARLFQRSAVASAVALLAGFAMMIFVALALRPAAGEGFYAVISHAVMVSIFVPAFMLPIVAVAISLRRYWRDVDGQPVRVVHFIQAFSRAARLADLSGGQGQGCNFEDGDRYSDTRRWMHQMVLYGFLLCFASTCSATVMHFGFDWPAPYGLLTPPKLLGLPGGVLLSLGCAGLLWLKSRADPTLGDVRAQGGDTAFVLLLFIVSTSGLALYVFGDSSWLSGLLAFHLGSVLAFFVTTPYSKMVHGFFRLAALVRDAQDTQAGD